MTKYEPMKRIIKLISLIAFVYCQSLNAQTYCGLIYSYDAAGNRVKREIREDCPETEGGGGGGAKTELESSNSLSKRKSQFSITTFPNPTSDLVFVSFSRPVDGAQLTVMDNLGRRLIMKTVSGNSTSFNLSSFSDGIYYVSILVEEGPHSASIIKN
jgi:hypothetical protein